ncbi:hypothetical protein [Aureimonas sp. AU40]|uniref:hypothetical protein n=1 Tax=Aureimonas sp. AU40 TaxID=1637747 RepID=UPI0007829592|nr:hypothetical protein [Aureimonas sp. AU40]
MVEDRDSEFERLRVVPFEELRAEIAEPVAAPVPVSVPTPPPEVTAAAVRSGAVYDENPTDRPFLLRYPFKIGIVRYDNLLFRPPAFEDVEAVVRGETTEQEMHARMADVPVEALRALRWVDSEIATFIARSLCPEFNRR